MVVFSPSVNTFILSRYNCGKTVEVVCSMHPYGYCNRYRIRCPRFTGGKLEISKVAEFVPATPKGVTVVFQVLSASSTISCTCVTGGLGLRTSISISSVAEYFPEVAVT